MNKLQERQLCLDFLSYYKFQNITPIDSARIMNKTWGISIDWHVFSNVLGILRSTGHYELVGHTNSNMTIYSSTE